VFDIGTNTFRHARGSGAQSAVWDLFYAPPEKAREPVSRQIPRCSRDRLGSDLLVNRHTSQTLVIREDAAGHLNARGSTLVMRGACEDWLSCHPALPGALGRRRSPPVPGVALAGRRPLHRWCPLGRSPRPSLVFEHLALGWFRLLPPCVSERREEPVRVVMALVPSRARGRFGRAASSINQQITVSDSQNG
jgi:hypothetical protein